MLHQREAQPRLALCLKIQKLQLHIQSIHNDPFNSIIFVSSNVKEERKVCPTATPTPRHRHNHSMENRLYFFVVRVFRIFLH